MIYFILFWIICGVLHYGMHMAYFQRAFPTIARFHYNSDRKNALWMSLFGPAALLAHLLFLIFNIKRWHGFLYKKEIK